MYDKDSAVCSSGCSCVERTSVLSTKFPSTNGVGGCVASRKRLFVS